MQEAQSIQSLPVFIVVPCSSMFNGSILNSIHWWFIVTTLAAAAATSWNLKSCQEQELKGNCLWQARVFGPVKRVNRTEDQSSNKTACWTEKRIRPFCGSAVLRSIQLTAVILFKGQVARGSILQEVKNCWLSLLGTANCCSAAAAAGMQHEAWGWWWGWRSMQISWTKLPSSTFNHSHRQLTTDNRQLTNNTRQSTPRNASSFLSDFAFSVSISTWFFWFFSGHSRFHNDCTLIWRGRVW